MAEIYKENVSNIYTYLNNACNPARLDIFVCTFSVKEAQQMFYFLLLWKS